MRALTWVCARADGAMLGVADEVGLLRLWDTAQREVVHRFAVGDAIVRGRWLPDGRLLVARIDGRLFVRSGDGRHELAEITTGHGRLRDVAVDARHRRLATCGEDGMLRLWDLSTLAPRAELRERTTSLNCVGFAGDVVIAGCGDGYQVGWRGEDGQRLAAVRITRAPLSALGVDPSGQRLVFGTEQGGLHEVLVGGAGEWPLGRSWQDPPRQIAVNAIELAANGSLLAACSDGTALWLRSLDSSIGLTLGEPFWRQRPRPEWSREYVVSAACFVPGGNLVATAHGDGTLRLWRGVLRDATITFEQA